MNTRSINLFCQKIINRLAVAVMLAAIFMLATAKTSHSAEIVVVSPIEAWGAGNDPHYLIDQSGVFESGVTKLADLLSEPFHGDLGGQFGGSDHIWPVFDLGESMMITGMLIWQGSNYYLQAIREIAVRVREDGAEWQEIARVYPDENGNPAYMNLPDVQARYIQWGDTVNYGNGRSTIVNEVAFSVEGYPVPEPSLVFLISIGIAGIAAISRKNIF